MDRPLPSRSPQVVFRRVTDGAVLLSTRDEVYFGLDPVGAQIWELMGSEVSTLDDLCEALHGVYPDVELATLRADVAELLEAMLEAGLLDPAGTDGRGSVSARDPGG